MFVYRPSCSKLLPARSRFFCTSFPFPCYFYYYILSYVFFLKSLGPTEHCTQMVKLHCENTEWKVVRNSKRSVDYFGTRYRRVEEHCLRPLQLVQTDQHNTWSPKSSGMLLFWPLLRIRVGVIVELLLCPPLSLDLSGVSGNFLKGNLYGTCLRDTRIDRLI